MSIEKNRTITESDLKLFVSDALGIPLEKVDLDSKFIEDLGADSLDIVEMIMKVEEKYSISIGDKDAEKLQTMRDLFNYLETNLALGDKDSEKPSNARNIFDLDTNQDQASNSSNHNQDKDSESSNKNKI